MKRLAFFAAGVLSAASPVLAQEAAVVAAAPQPVAVIQAPEAANVLRSGTELTLEMREELTTKGKKLKIGRRFQMATAGDVVANGVVVIPSGTPAIGEVVEVKNKGMWGKSGYIGAKIVSLNLNGHHVRLTGSFDDKGVTGTAGVVGSIALVPIAGFFVTGTSAVLPMGGQVKGFLDEDLHFRPVAAAPQVLEVPAAGGVAEASGAAIAPLQAQPAMRMDLPEGVVCETCKK